MKHTLTLLTALLLAPLAALHAAEPANVSFKGFRSPPTQARAMVYWDWLGGNLNRAAITRDLEHMRRVGLGGGLLFDVPPLHGAYVPAPPEGPVAFMSREWLDLVNFAAEESHRLGLDFGIVLCCAWNTGGPWIPPRQNNQLTASSLTRVTGPRAGAIRLPAPSDDPDYRDVAVVAWPVPAQESSLMSAFAPAISINGGPTGERSLRGILDGDRKTVGAVPAPRRGTPTTVEFIFPKPVTVDRLYIQEEPRFGIKAGRVETDVGGRAVVLARFTNDGRSPVLASFKPATSARFRLVATEAHKLGEQSKNMRLPEVEFMEPGTFSATAPAIRNWSLKTAALPALVRRNDESTLPTRHLDPTPNDGVVPALNRRSIQVLTGKLRAGGELAWDVPAGQWAILRFGMVPAHSRTYNSEGRKGNEGALESDKQSAEATRLHYRAMGKAILDRLSPAGRKGLGFFHLDSWEGELNLWTAGFAEEFKRRRGYDLIPWLPVFQGKVVGSGMDSDRVLWDYRRTIGDLNRDAHFKELASLCHADGLRLSAQAGHGFQANMDTIGCISEADHPSGEFWFGGRGARRDIRNSVKDAASAANVYGRPYALFESFTTGRFPNFWPSPFDLKQLGDYALAQGVSRMMIHGMWMDPIVDNKPPGTTWSAGIHVGPSITWMPDGRAFFDYLARCQYLLQAGVAEKDALYFYGDGMPNLTPKRDELPFALPAGRDYDAADGRAIRELISVKDGKLTLPHGAVYHMLVLPPLDAMLPETLTAIHRMVKAGAIVVGPKPLCSPSLSGQPQADATVRALADELWGQTPGPSGSKRTGQGTVHWGADLASVFAAHAIPPQIEVADASAAEIKFVFRRTTDGREFYFLANQGDKDTRPEIRFRSSGKAAFLWRPDSGDIFRLDNGVDGNGTTRLRIPLDPWGSVFVVFQPPTEASANAKPLPPEVPPTEAITLAGPWQVTFAKGRGAPAKLAFEKLESWTLNPIPGVKYFSGYGAYRKTFVLTPAQLANSKSSILLDLGAVGDVAHVKVNGRDLGALWKPPYRVDISAAVQAGDNQLEIAVVNTWVNRLIGDDQFVNQPPIANITARKLIPAPDLEKYPSGLLGPVKLQIRAPQEKPR
jgi:hypothetical protein